jgi:hypothetical protein
MRDILWQQLVREISNCPFLRSESLPQAADVTLAVTITGQEQSIATTSVEDSAIAESHLVTLTARCSLRDNRTDQWLFADEPVSARSHVPVRGGFVDNRYHMMPEITRDLAIRICALLNSW